MPERDPLFFVMKRATPLEKRGQKGQIFGEGPLLHHIPITEAHLRHSCPKSVPGKSKQSTTGDLLRNGHNVREVISHFRSEIQLQQVSTEREETAYAFMMTTYMR